MSRTLLSPLRQENTKNINFGHMILFCEGETEKCYFDFFISKIKKSKFDDIQIEVESAEGNSSRVLKFADSFLVLEDNNRKYSNYKKYLIFDCDAPPNIQKIINKMCMSENKYEMLISNYCFEIWLLMHFEDVTEKISKQQTYKRLSNHLTKEYRKANAGIIREIISKGDVTKAIKNADNLEKIYAHQKKTIHNTIVEMNPYTNVNNLVSQLWLAIN